MPGPIVHTALIERLEIPAVPAISPLFEPGTVPRTGWDAANFDASAVALASIAVSLKRIADMVCPDMTEQPGDRKRAEAPVDMLVSRLSPRLRDVLGLLVEGSTNKELARHLRISEATVKVHVKALFRLFQVRTRTELAVAALRMSQASAALVPAEAC